MYVCNLTFSVTYVCMHVCMYVCMDVLTLWAVNVVHVIFAGFEIDFIQKYDLLPAPLKPYIHEDLNLEHTGIPMH